MKNVVRLTFTVAAAALFACSAGEANAQTYDGGYRFGVGINQSNRFSPSNRFQGNQGRFRGGNNFGFGGIFYGGVRERQEDLPYFAKFPPVYYSGIVKRPYGISPFATPPGIIPTELQVAVPKPVTISNPFFNNDIEEIDTIQVETESNLDSSIDNKTTEWKANPYTEWQVSH